MKIETVLAHAGLCTDKTTGAVSTPIHQTATFRHPALGVSTGYDYSRTVNPTRQALERVMAELETGDRGFAFASGMAAITAILTSLSAGDHVIVSDDLYGGTYRVFEKCFRKFNVTATYVDTSNPVAVEEALMAGRTRAVFVETPTNPLMKITDLEAMVLLARAHRLLTIVDNTFMTPYFQRPLEFGVDVVVHSGTKYLGGHNDVLSGTVVTRTAELSETIGFIQNSTGAVLGPQDSWLMLRGIKTLKARMELQQQSAMEVARWLKRQPWVSEVYYPGLPDHPGHDLIKTQASGFGAVLSFKTNTVERARQIMKHVRLWSVAVSLGGVESILSYPVRMSHAAIPAAERERLGITDNLIRLSVGLEETSDLIADLEGKV